MAWLDGSWGDVTAGDWRFCLGLMIPTRSIINRII